MSTPSVTVALPGRPIGPTHTGTRVEADCPAPDQGNNVKPGQERRAAALAAATRRRAEMRAAGISVARLDPIEKAHRNPGSMRAAVNGKCWECSGKDIDSGTRQRIRDCPITDCCLFSVRPFQGIKGMDRAIDAGRNPDLAAAEGA